MGTDIGNPADPINQMIGPARQRRSRISNHRVDRVADDLRIDKEAFRNIDVYEMMALAGLYHTANHKLLISLLKEIKRHG